jgi:hypothetical protein
MTMRIRNQRDFWAGLMFIAFGLAFMYWSQDYQMGTAAKMGPAYFPTILGGLMAFLGLVILVPSVRLKAPVVKVDRIDLRANGIVLLAVALYGFLLPTMGFVIAMVALVMVSAAASHEFSWRESLLNAVALTIGSWIVFVKGLDLQFPVWPIFLTR